MITIDERFAVLTTALNEGFQNIPLVEATAGVFGSRSTDKEAAPTIDLKAAREDR